jgi:NAD(P)-dependent dehydrogenase (short-subunit alcohol dehydrogenase family)
VEKTAVVTGGASGIGRRTVERLLSEGWTVWAFDLSEEGLAQQAMTLNRGGRYHTQRCDVSDVESITAAFDAVRRETDTLDALVCSAGVTLTGSLEEIPAKHVNLMIDVNLKGPWLTVRGALPLLREKASATDPSRVVIIGSIGGIRPKVGNGFYSATKAAVHVLVGIFAVELAPTVLVNAVAPGTVDTPMVTAAASAAGTSGYKPSGDSPLGRIGQPDDIADVTLFYLSDAAKFVTGTVLPVDGGTRAAFVKT